MGDREVTFDKLDDDALREMESALRCAGRHQLTEHWTHVGHTVMRDRGSQPLARSVTPEVAEFIVHAVNSFGSLLANLRAARAEVWRLKAGE